MREIKKFGEYLGRCFMKWLNWVKPTSSLWAKVSLASAIIGGVAWLFSKINPNTSISEFASIVGFWVFWVGVALSVGMLIFWAPYKINKEDRDQLEPLVSFRNSQKTELLNSPASHIFMLVKRIVLNISAKENTTFADIEIYVMNGSMFRLDYDFRFKETYLTLDNVNLGNLSDFPTLYQKGADYLGVGSLSTSTIRQKLSGSVATDLLSAVKSKYVQWTFNIFLTISFDGQTKSQEYKPEWDGVLDRVWER